MGTTVVDGDLDFGVGSTPSGQLLRVRDENRATTASGAELVDGYRYYQTVLDEVHEVINGVAEVIWPQAGGIATASDLPIVDAANDFTATNVEDALAELQTDHEADAQALADHISDAADAHAGTAITNTPAGTIAAITAQAAINELDGDIQGHISDATAAHAATAVEFTPAQNIAATNVQAAIEEVVVDLTAAVTAATEGKAWKDPVRAASTATVTLANGLENGDSLDGVTLATGDRVLLKNQVAPAEDGIYIVVASGAAGRAPDMNTADEADNATVLVEAGTVNGGDVYTQTADIVTIGTTAMVWVKSSEGNTIYTADESTLELIGSQYREKDAGTTNAKLANMAQSTFKMRAAGAGTGPPIDGTVAQAKTALAYTAAEVVYVGGTGMAATDVEAAIDELALEKVSLFGDLIGDGVATDIDVTHNFNTIFVKAEFHVAATGAHIVVPYDAATGTPNKITAHFVVAPATDAIRVTVEGRIGYVGG